MPQRRLAAVDAQTLWMSRIIASDQYLLYAFDGVPGDLDAALDAAVDRARSCADLGLRVADTGGMTYPAWVPRPPGTDQVVVHDIAEKHWAGCLDAVAVLTDIPLDAEDMTWRLHVFAGIGGVPGQTAAGTVVVLQICHALADGVRASQLAAWLLGRDARVPAVPPMRTGTVVAPALAVRAARAHRRLVRGAAAGLVPPQGVPVPALHSNELPSGPRRLRTVVCPRAELRRPTVTVGALVAVSAALAGHLRALGDDTSRLRAEVPMAKTAARQSHNHFGNVGIGLFPDEENVRRAQLIAADLHARRRRAAHPAARAEDAAFAAVPASVLRWGVGQFDPGVRSPTVTGNTVVSSVDRGPADLAFGSAPVVLTAGFPSLSPMMGVTHGVHGIGSSVAVSVHAAESSIADIDAYADRLAWELRAPSR